MRSRRLCGGLGLLLVVGLVTTAAATGCKHEPCPTACWCSPDLTVVNCNGQGFTEIPILHCHAVKELYLDDNHLEELSVNSSLRTLHYLEVLSLSGNKLTDVPSDVLALLPQLRQLYLARNSLSSSSSSSSAGGKLQLHILKQLHTLDLSNNQLTDLPVDDLEQLASRIEVLKLAGNQITAQVFPSNLTLPKLRVLDLSGNRQNGVSFEQAGAENLESLNLSHCAIKQLPANAFEGLVNLTSLWLAGNNVNETNLATVLKNTPNNTLHTLDLSRLALTQIPNDFFSNQLRLERLDLSQNELTVCEVECLSGLGRLQWLDLQGNLLTDFNALHGLNQLEELVLRNNRFESVETVGLHRLVVLDLSQNDIKQLPVNLLSNMRALRQLNLSSNTIESIHPKAFHGINLDCIDLSHNRLPTLNDYGFMKIRHLQVGHNRIRMINDTAFRNIENYLEEVDLSHNFLDALPHQTFENFRVLSLLNLSHNNLGVAFHHSYNMQIFRNLGRLHTLDLSYNNIMTLPGAPFEFLHNLQRLNLHGNIIRHLFDAALLEVSLSLEEVEVDLSMNNISVVDTRILDRIQALSALNLADNPFHCGCDMLDFIEWLNDTSVNITSIESANSRYVCRTPLQWNGKSIFLYQPEGIECHSDLQDHLAWIGIALLVLGVLAIVTVLIFYYCRVCRRLKELKYKLQVRYKRVTGDEGREEAFTSNRIDNEEPLRL